MPKNSADGLNSGPELLAPAGGFAAGYYALEAGADAVYLGLKSFSARRSARNFDLDELSRLKALAARRGKRIYVAINTIIREEELPEAAGALYDLESLGVDGVIVQDFGLLAMLRRDFPNLTVHASTQMAVHNASGIEFLQSLGVRRVILSRELSLEEIGRLKRRHPGMELEVFIHGALCYGFSGLCLASGLTVGRSANRGECAQLCRGWYELQSGTTGCFFSCNDLHAGGLVLELAALGIDGLKIEGRMKPPEYVRWVTRYYRGLLDGAPKEETDHALERSRLVFSRGPSSGWLSDARGENLTGPDFPGHRGLPAGVVERSERGFFLIRLALPLAVRDGLQFLPPARPEAFAVEELRLDRQGSFGERVFQADRGARVWVRGDADPPRGAVVNKISHHAETLPEPKPGSFKPYRRPLRVSAEVTDDGLRLEVPDFPPGSAWTYQDCRPERGRVRKNLSDALAPFLDPPGDSRFCSGGLLVKNGSSLPDDEIYINPSSLKKARRDFFARLEALHADQRRRRLDEAVRPALESAPRAAELELPDRDGLTPDGFGFYLPTQEIEDYPLVNIPGQSRPLRMLPLFPVLFNDEEYFTSTRTAVLAHLEAHPGEAIGLGLGNAGHLHFARELADRDRVFFFIDYGLYLANNRSAAFFAGLSARVIFAYPWIEDPNALPPPASALALARYGGFEAPRFISRACLWRHSLSDAAGGCAGCGKSGSLALRDGKRRYRVEKVSIAGSCLNLTY